MSNVLFHIADRLQLFNVDEYIELLNRLRFFRIQAVSISNHERGGYFEPQYIEDMKRVLAHCRVKGIQVYMTCMDGSKWNAGSPTGLEVKNGPAHRPLLKESRIDGHRVAFRALLHSKRVYRFSFSANMPCTVFLRDAESEWQMIKYGTAQTGAGLEIPTVKGAGGYEVLFVGQDGLEVSMTRPIAETSVESLSGTLNRYGKPEGRTFQKNGLWYYRGGEGYTGNGYCRTPNFADLDSRRIARQETFGRIFKTYREFIGDPIVGTYLKWDEFNMLGDLCDGSDMVKDMKLCGAISDALGGPALIDARPGDFAAESRCNRRDAALNGFCYIGLNDGLIPIGWAEETTPEIARETKLKLVDGAWAGVYLDKGNPTHFYDVGFRKAAVYWWPDNNHPTWLDFPQDKLDEIVEVFG